ncbi:MAG: Ig-like domain-containing protein, partial [Terriglobales bacterium]
MTGQRFLRIKSRALSVSVLFLAVFAVLTALASTARAQIDSTNRTVTTSSFVVGWYTGNDTEAIINMTWSGGANLTSYQGLGTCFPSFPGSIEYFGNSYAPPDPWAGGLVLVGGGTTTPAGTTAWSGQVLPSGTDQVTINSSSTGCPPSSAGINVQTTYSFVNPTNSSTNWFGVQRAFDFTTTTFAHDFRPYMPRLSLSEGFTDVLYPAIGGALATLNVYDCGYGCTGPVVIPDAVPLNPLWDATQGWFAIHNPNTLEGVVVKRNPSVDPQGNPIVAQLWVDNDGGSNTNVSSFLLMSPTGGFTAGPVTEVETLCFYNSSIWTPSLTPPAGCGGTPTNTTLASSLNPSNYGQTVTFTASVSSTAGTPTGSVVFTDATTSTTLGSATLASGSASISVSSLGAGSHSITAAYEGSTGFSGSTSAPLNQVVNGVTTTTALASSLNPSVYGQAVTFTAAVSSASGTPTGTVVFSDTSTSTTLGSATLSSGKAAISVSSLAAGSNSISAAYQGSGTFAGSTSAPLSQKVNIATTTTSLTSSLNPASTGQSVSLTATVTSQYGGAATGSVTFLSGSQTLGTATLSGNRATLSTSFTTAGTDSVTAKYGGDANDAGSTSSVLSQVIINATTTTLTSSLNPSVVGQAVTFTATVSSTAGAPPNGETVTFNNGSAVLGTATLSAGIASLTTSSLPAGTLTITASYGGDANFAASTSPGLRQVVNSTTKSATSTALVSTLNPSIYGQKVTWTATVTTSGSVTPTGKVNFTWDGYSIGTATLNASGVATLSKSNLNVYTYPLTAVYAGDANNVGSTSAILNQVVKETTSAATLSSSANPSTEGQAVTFTATITSPTVTATGPVTFTAGKTVLGTAELSGHKATFTTSTLAAGSTTVTATYAGDSNI